MSKNMFYSLCWKLLSEIYSLADKFDHSPHLKQNGEEKNGMKIQMVLFGYNTKTFIYSKVAYIFPMRGRHNIFFLNLGA